ncbi:hypothetical protein [Mesorhizobium caraganae]|uniref:hypothetical protein n=1 Tax=Mesorhizobium caraganae TaxID=483206 RepID=UPI003ED14ED1
MLKSDDESARLIDFLNTANADLIVSGAYGHSRIKDGCWRRHPLAARRHAALSLHVKLMSARGNVHGVFVNNIPAMASAWACQ